MIQDAAKHGLDLTDPRVTAELTRLDKLRAEGKDIGLDGIDDDDEDSGVSKKKEAPSTLFTVVFGEPNTDGRWWRCFVLCLVVGLVYRFYVAGLLGDGMETSQGPVKLSDLVNFLSKAIGLSDEDETAQSQVTSDGSDTEGTFDPYVGGYHLPADDSDL